MTRFRLLLAAFGVMVLSLVLLQPVRATIASQQAQIGVTIVVPVSGTPVAYDPHEAPASSRGITSAIALRRITPAMASEFEAQSLHLEHDSTLIAQAQVQNSVLVQAEVTPNPKATILYSNYPSYTFNPGVAPGSTVQAACAFTVTVDMTSTWSLEEGLTSNFSSTWPGNDLSNDTYKNSATPQPTSTPYVVYATDGSEWSLLGTGTTETTYCVTLTITVPASITDGTYSTNAIFTLFN